MERARFLLAVCVTFTVFCHTGYAQQNPTMRMEYKNDFLENPASVLVKPDQQSYNVDIKVTCSFPSISPSDSASVIIRSRANDSSEWNLEMQCFYSPGGDPSSVIFETHSIGDDVVGGEEAIACTRDSLSFVLRFSSGLPLDYSCLQRDNLRFVDKNSSPFQIRSYTKPTDPVISTDKETLVEGEGVTFTCTSEAKPPPNLRFKLNDVPVDLSADKLTPPADSVEPNSPSMRSSLVFSTTARQSMHDTTLTCETVDHPYGTTVSTSQQLLVAYGPSTNQVPVSKSLAVESGSPAVVTCSMAAYPTLKYRWLFKDRLVHKGQNISITDYADTIYEADGSYPQEIALTCVGENPASSALSARKVYTITLSNPRFSAIITTTEAENTAAPPGESNQDGVGSMEPWMIGVIVAAIAVALIVIILIAVCCAKRRRSRQNPKAMQARRQSDDRSDENVTKYQSSTSLSRQSDGRQPNYHENPTLPVDYRYSQASAHSVDALDGMIDAKPRSRKPIALEDLDRLDADTAGPPQYGEAPPAYSSAPSPYSKNDGYRSPNYDNSYLYGAAC